MKENSFNVELSKDLQNYFSVLSIGMQALCLKSQDTFRIDSLEAINQDHIPVLSDEITASMLAVKLLLREQGATLRYDELYKRWEIEIPRLNIYDSRISLGELCASIWIDL